MRECLAFFLAQDYPAKRLFILNNHPVPLRCDLPEVTVFNEPSDEPGIPRNRLLAKVPNEFEFVHTWDDDDAWLPWHLSQAVRQIELRPTLPGTKSFRLEAGAVVDPLHRDRRVRSSTPTTTKPRCSSGATLHAGASATRRPAATSIGRCSTRCKADKALATTEVGARSSYIYSWRGDFTHASAALARDMKSGVHAIRRSPSATPPGASSRPIRATARRR